MTEFRINSTDFTLDHHGQPDRITTIHWSASKAVGELTASSYGTLPCDFDALSTTEADLITFVTAKLGNIDTQLQAQIDAKAIPNSAQGMPWEVANTPDALSGRKERLRLRVNELREELLDEGITVNGVEFQSRPGDRENIAGALQLATLAASQGQPFSIEWIAKDNTVHTLDFAFIVALGQAVANRKAELIFRGRAVKDQIAAATTPAELPDVELAMQDPVPTPEPTPAP